MLKATATISREQDKELGTVIKVDVAWSGAPLDRPSTGGFLLNASHMRLAQRLKAAVDAQVVYVNPKVATDINGHTFATPFIYEVLKFAVTSPDKYLSDAAWVRPEELEVTVVQQTFKRKIIMMGPDDSQAGSGRG